MSDEQPASSADPTIPDESPPPPPPSEPWDYVEPQIYEGDPDYNDILRGMGLVMHRWTQVEIAFSYLHAILKDKPRDGGAIQAYATGRVFTSRFAGLRSTATKFFIRNCHQAHEAEIDELMRQAEQFSIRRNEVAHAVIRPVDLINMQSGEHKARRSYLLSCPYFDLRDDTAGDYPRYLYNTATLTRLADNLEVLRDRIEVFGDNFMPADAELAGHRSWIAQLIDD